MKYKLRDVQWIAQDGGCEEWVGVEGEDDGEGGGDGVGGSPEEEKDQDEGGRSDDVARDEVTGEKARIVSRCESVRAAGGVCGVSPGTSVCASSVHL